MVMFMNFIGIGPPFAPTLAADIVDRGCMGKDTAEPVHPEQWKSRSGVTGFGAQSITPFAHEGNYEFPRENHVDHRYRCPMMG